MSLETLHNDYWKLVVAPEVGASVAGLYANIAGAWQAILRDTPEDAIKAGNPSPFSSFTLAPYSNRLKDAKFNFLGETHQLKATSNDGSTQHGDVRGQHWQLINKTKTKLELSLDTRDCGAFNFPFPFIMSMIYELKANVLITRMQLTNVGQTPMPAGFGIHPYFNRHLAGSQEVRLEFKAEGHYEVDEHLIPTGKVPKPTAEYAFKKARAVADFALNDLYRDWSDLSLVWPNTASLKIYADAVFKHLIVFTHADGSLAVEPVSNATDGFNLMARGAEGHGVRVLSPQESLSGSIFFELKT